MASSSSSSSKKPSPSSSKKPLPTRPPMQIVKGINGLDAVILRDSRWSSCEVYLYGAHVTSWKNERGQELLFSSIKAIYDPARAIHGGIPISFPQFGTPGPLGLHGFARDRLWAIETHPPPFTRPPNTTHTTFVDLILTPSEELKRIWPHSFEFRLRVSMGNGGDMMLTYRVRNVDVDGKPFSFTIAFPAYFKVSDVGEVRVEGLETLHYLDNLKEKELFTEQGDAITFEAEVDKTYLSAPNKIAIIDHERRRTYVLRKEGLPDVVVWNPWDKKSKAMPREFKKDDYKGFVCVGAAVMEHPIKIRPGQEWTGSIELSLVNSSYNSSGELDPQKVLSGSSS